MEGRTRPRHRRPRGQVRSATFVMEGTVPTPASSSSASCSPPAARQYNLQSRGAKRTTRDEVVDSPPRKKMSGSLEDCSCSRVIFESISCEQEEMNLVIKKLEEDGIYEGSELYCKAIYLFKNSWTRAVFTRMRTRETRLSWIHFSWDNQ